MKLVDMRSEAANGLCYPEPMCSSPYPYGIRLTLNQEQLAQLGYDALPPAGTLLRIEAVGCVTRSSSEDPDADGDIDYLCVEVQITEMGIEEEAATGSDTGGRAGRMYGKE